MANFGNANLGFFSGGATGGGGGISGSGTTNNIPKWASSSSLTDSLLSDSGTILKTTYLGSDRGLLLNFSTSTLSFGFPTRATLQVTLDEWVCLYAGVNQGIVLDFGNLFYSFGQIDDGGTTPNIRHFIDGQNGSKGAYFQFESNRIGYEFDFGATKTFKFGDVVGAYGTCRIELDATNNTMVFKADQSAGSTTFEANSLVFTGANIEDAGAAPSGTPTYLKITLNGTIYYILCTP